MEQLYLALLQMPVAMQAEKKGEEYSFLVLAYTSKEDLKQVVKEGMLIRNRNFVQSVKLVHS